MTLDLISQEVRDMVQPGRSLHMYKSKKSKFLTKKIHIRAIVDDEHVVYRFWSAQRGWIYTVDDMYYFQVLYEKGNLE